MELIFSKNALKNLKKLSVDDRRRVVQKIKYYSQLDDPLQYAEPLVRHSIGEYRFRIGDYRAIFDYADNKITVLKIGHRRDIYK